MARPLRKTTAAIAVLALGAAAGPAAADESTLEGYGGEAGALLFALGLPGGVPAGALHPIPSGADAGAAASDPGVRATAARSEVDGLALPPAGGGFGGPAAGAPSGGGGGAGDAGASGGAGGGAGGGVAGRVAEASRAGDPGAPALAARRSAAGGLPFSTVDVLLAALALAALALVALAPRRRRSRGEAA